MTDTFGFIEAERAETEGLLPPVDRMCALLEVSKSGYYEWRGRPPSEAARRRELLADKVRALFEAFHRTYGYRRVHAELVRGGERVGRGLVAKLMAEMGLVPVQPRPFRKTTEPDPDAAEKRLTSLEEHAGFAEHTVEQLSAEITELNKRVHTLASRMSALEDRLGRLLTTSDEPSPPADA